MFPFTNEQLRPVRTLCLLFLVSVLAMTACTEPGCRDESLELQEELCDLAFTDPEMAMMRCDSAEQAGLFDASTANATRALICENSDRKLLAAYYAELAINDPATARDSDNYVMSRWVLSDCASDNGEYGKSMALADEVLAFVEGRDDLKPRVWRSVALALKAECESSLEHNELAYSLWIASIDNLIDGATHPRSYMEVDPMFYNAATLSESYILNGVPERTLDLLPILDTAMARLARCLDAEDFVFTMRRNNYLILKARLLAINGQLERADSLYHEHRAIEDLPFEDIWYQGVYLVDVGRYDEAIQRFNVADSMHRATGEPLTFEYVDSRFSYEYDALKKAGRTADALALADSIFHLTDSVRIADRLADIEQIKAIRMQQEEIAQKRQSIAMHRIILVAAFVIILLIVILLRRAYLYNRELTAKNIRLLAEIEKREQAEQTAIERLEAQPVESLTGEQQLFRRLCQLMENPDLFTDADLDRSRLAQMLGTNEHYVSDAVNACADGKSVTEFLNGYRLRHAAHLLATTDDSIALIAELSGFSRRSFYRLFNEAYSMSPNDYRAVARKNIK